MGYGGDLCQIGELLKKKIVAHARYRWNRMRIKICCNKNSYQAMRMLKMFTHVRSGAATSSLQHETVHCIILILHSFNSAFVASAAILLPVLYSSLSNLLFCCRGLLDSLSMYR
jgi:hypothetical protein